MIYRLDPNSRFLSDEEKKRLREAQENGFGVIMPGQWAERLMNEIDALRRENEILHHEIDTWKKIAQGEIDGPQHVQGGEVSEEAGVLPLQGDSEPV